MAIVKHGEGSILPDNDRQKTAAQHRQGMSPEDAEALRQENEAADAPDGD